MESSKIESKAESKALGDREKKAHSYRCAGCGLVFGCDSCAVRCPECGCKVLIHLEGEALHRSACSGDCSCCGGCSH